jgi:hypothetical protein
MPAELLAHRLEAQHDGDAERVWSLLGSRPGFVRLARSTSSSQTVLGETMSSSPLTCSTAPCPYDDRTPFALLVDMPSLCG